MVLIFVPGFNSVSGGLLFLGFPAQTRSCAHMSHSIETVCSGFVIIWLCVGDQVMLIYSALCLVSF